MIYGYKSNENDFTYDGKALPLAYDVVVTRDTSYYVSGKYPLDEAKTYKLLKEGYQLKVHTPQGQRVFALIKPTKHDTYIEFEGWPLFLFRMRNKQIKPLYITNGSGQVALTAFMNGLKTPQPQFSLTSNISGKHDYNTQDTNDSENELYDAIDVFQAIVSRWSGEVDFNDFDIRMLDRIGSNSGALLHEEKNISEYVDEISVADLVTRIYAISEWEDEDETKHKIEVTVESPLINSYDGIVYEKQYRNNDIKTENELRAWANLKFSTDNMDKPKRNISVTTNIINGTSVSYGDTLVLNYVRHDVDMEIKVVGYTYDGYSDKYLSVELGSPKLTMSDTISNKISDVESNVSQKVRDGFKSIVNDLGVKIIYGGTYPDNQPTGSFRNGDMWFTDDNKMYLWDSEKVMWVSSPINDDMEHVKQEVLKAIESGEDAKQLAKDNLELAKADATAKVAQSDAQWKQKAQEIEADTAVVKKQADDAMDKAQANAQNLITVSNLLDTTKVIADNALARGNQAFDKASQAITHADDIVKDVRADLVITAGNATKALTDAQKALTDLDGLSDRTTYIEADIDDITGALQYKVSTTDFDGLKRTVDKNALDISANTKEIGIKASSQSVETLSGRVSEAEGQIQIQSGLISQRLTASQVDTLVNKKGYAVKTDVNEQIRIVTENINSVSSNLATTNATVTDLKNARGNLVVKSRFEDNKIGGWAGASLYTITSPDFVNRGINKVLVLSQRSNLETANSIPVTPNEMYYGEGYFSTISSNVALKFGVLIKYSDNSVNSMYFGTLEAGKNWTKITGSITIPDNVVSIQPLILLDGTENLGTGLAVDMKLTSNATIQNMTAFKNTIEQRIGQNESLIASKVSLDAVKTEIDSRGYETVNNVTSFKNSITQRVSDAENAITAKAESTTVDKLTGRVKSAEGQLELIPGKFTVLNQTVNDGLARVGALEVGSESLSSSLSTVKSDVTDLQNARGNLVIKNRFEDGQKGKWANSNIYSISYKPLTDRGITKVLQLLQRSTPETYNDIPVTPSDIYYGEVWLNGFSANVPLRFGILIKYDGYYTSSFFGSVQPGQNWTKVSGTVTIPANAVSIQPLLLMDGNDNLGTGFAVEMKISGNATVEDLSLLQQDVSGFKTTVQSNYPTKDSVISQINQKADSVQQDIQSWTNGELTNYSTTKATASSIASAVADKATKTEVAQLSNQYTVLSTNAVKNLMPNFTAGFNQDTMPNVANYGDRLILNNQSSESPKRVFYPASAFGQATGKIYSYRFSVELTNGSGTIGFGSANAIETHTLKSGKNTYAGTFTVSDVTAFSIVLSAGVRVVLTEPLLIEGGSGVTQSMYAQTVKIIGFKVERDELISQINIQAGQTLIESQKLVLKASTVQITGDAFIQGAYIVGLNANKINGNAADFNTVRAGVLQSNVITGDMLQVSSGMIDKLFSDAAYINVLTAKQTFVNNIKALEINASKITSGTLNAANVNVININANNIVANNLSNIRTNTGSLNVSGWLTFTTPNAGLSSTYDFEDADVSFYKRRFVGSYTNGYRYQVYSARVTPTFDGADPNSGYHANSMFGPDMLKLRSYDNSTDLNLQARTDIYSGQITMSDAFGDNKLALYASGELYAGLVVMTGELYGTKSQLQISSKDGANFRIGNDSSGGYFRSDDIYKRTYGSSANVFINEYGNLGRTVSASKYKLDITYLDEELTNNILELRPAKWFDKNAIETYVETLNTGKSAIYDEPTPIQRYYGLIAEDLIEAGLGFLCVYGKNGEVEGIQYDRIGPMLIPIIKELKQEIEELKQRVA